MGKRVPLHDEDRIIALWLQGTPRSAIEREVGVSAGKISNTVNLENELIGEANVEALRRLAMEVGKHKHSMTDLLHAVRFLNACARIEMDVDTVIEILPRVDSICKSEGVKLDFLPLDLQSKIRASKEIELRNEALKKELTDLEESRTQKVREDGQTDAMLAKFSEWHGFFSEHGLSPDEPEKILNVFFNAKETNYDLNELIKTVSKIKSLDKEKTSLSETVQKQLRQMNENDGIIGTQSSQISEASDRLERVSELERMGCTARMLGAIADAVKRMAEDGKLSTEQAAEKFAGDVHRAYEPLAGFERAIAMKQEEQEFLQDVVKKLGEEYSKDWHAITTLRTLHDGGVGEADLFAIKNLVEKEGRTLSEISDAVTLHGSLGNMIRKSEARVKDSDVEATDLASKVSTLKKIATELDQSNNYAKFILGKLLNSVIDEVRRVSTDIHNESICIVQASIKARQDLSANMEQTIRRVAAIGDAADGATRRYMKTQAALAFEPLARALGGRRVDAKELLGPTLLAMTALLAALPARSGSRNPLEIAIKTLKEDIEIDILDLQI